MVEPPMGILVIKKSNKVSLVKTGNTDEVFGKTFALVRR